MTPASNPVRTGKVVFVGAGPGAADLLTLRGAKAIADADVVVWAKSLVMESAVTDHARPDAEVVDSLSLTLEDLAAIYDRAAAEGLLVARVHSGDPALYGAIGEQIALVQATRVDGRGLDWEIIPGVSSLGAAAAALGRELTVPEVAQSAILTRLATATPMPAKEDVRAFAAFGTTMALFLSAKRGRKLQSELEAGGYPADTPCAIAYRVTWPDELLVTCQLGDLAATLRAHGITRHALVLVGPALGVDPAATRSRLYDGGFSHAFRPATSDVGPSGGGGGA